MGPVPSPRWCGLGGEKGGPERDPGQRAMWGSPIGGDFGGAPSWRGEVRGQGWGEVLRSSTFCWARQ